MPAAYDIYSDQLRELRRGQALYYPEPSPEDGPVEIGDVGYTKQGAFCRLFNVGRSANDPAQILGVPQGFEPLDMGRIRTFDAALEPGPLHSKTIFRVNADIGSPGLVLPAEASFRFSCTSSRGAILMLETQMIRQQALHEGLFKNYLLQNCLSWYSFARDLGVQVEFGDIMLVTECSKTAAWASAVYSQSSKEFGMSFSAGGAFLPSAGGIAVAAGQDRIGPVEYRRSQRRALTASDIEGVMHDQTVFVKAYRLGSRSLYLRSLAHKIMKTKNRPRQFDDPDQDDSKGASPSRAIQNNTSYASPSRSTQSNNSMDLAGTPSDRGTFLFPEWPDFHPSVALLAHLMETTNVEIAAVHDDEWCSTFSKETARIIDDYAQCFFSENFLGIDEKLRLNNISKFSLSTNDKRSTTTSEEVAKFELLRGQGIHMIEPDKTVPDLPVELSEPHLVPHLVMPPEPSTEKNSINQKVQPTPVKQPPPLQMPKEMIDTWRITLLGDGGVGKTALAVQFTLDTFVEVKFLTYDPTIEDLYRRILPIDKQKCFVEIIDTAGQEEYASLREHHVRDGQGFALVYSVASRTTFERLEVFRQAMLRVKKYPRFVLVANKIDKFYEREVSTQEGEELAKQFGCEYIETSAKTGISVQKVFSDLVRTLRGSKTITPNKTSFASPSKGSKRGCVLM